VGGRGQTEKEGRRERKIERKKEIHRAITGDFMCNEHHKWHSRSK